MLVMSNMYICYVILLVFNICPFLNVISFKSSSTKIIYANSYFILKQRTTSLQSTDEIKLKKNLLKKQLNEIGINSKSTSSKSIISDITKQSTSGLIADLDILKRIIPRKVEDRRQFMKELQSIIPSLPSYDLANVLIALSNLKLVSRSKEMLIVCDLLVERLDKVSETITSTDFTLALQGLARLGIKCPKRVSTKIRSKDFFQALPRTLESMNNPTQVSDTMWALGKIGANWDGFPLIIQRAIMTAIIRTAPHMSSLNVANTIHGLSNQKAQWQTLPATLITALQTALERTIQDMNEQETSNCISGLGKLGVQWQYSINPSIRQKLGIRFLNNIDSLGAKGLAMSVHGLGKMNTDMSLLPSNFRESIMAAIAKIAPDLNAFEVSNILYGLGRMSTDMSGVRQEFGLTRKARVGLMDAFLREAWQMNAQGVSNSLWGLMQMNTRWKMLPKDLQYALLQALAREAPRMDEQEIGNTLYSLSCLEIAWKEHIPRDIKDRLLFTLEETADDMTTGGVVIMLLGLSKLRLSWAEIPLSVQSKLSVAIQRVLRNASDRTLSTCIHAMSGLGMRWAALNPVLQTSIQESIAKSSHIEFKSLSIKPTINNTNIDEEFSKLSSTVALSNMPSSSAAAFLLSYPFQREKISPLKSSSSEQQSSFPSYLSKFPFKPLQSSNNSSLITVVDGDTGDDVLKILLLPKPISTEEATATLTTTSSISQQLMNSNMTDSLPKIMRSSAKYVHANMLTETTSIPKIKTHFEGSISRIEWVKQVKTSSNPTHPNHIDRNFAISDNNVFDKTITSHNGFKGHYVYSLGLLRVPWDELGISSRISLCASLNIALPSLSEQGVVNSLHGLSSIGAKWDDLSLSPEVRKTILTSIIRVAPNMGEQGVSMTILALARMEVCWAEDLTDQVRIALRNAIVRQSDLSEHALSNLLYGLGKLERPWNELHPEVRHALKAAIVVCHLKNTCTALGVANSLYGLAHMQADWRSLSSSVRLALLNEVSKIMSHTSASHLCSILSSMGKLGVIWSKIPEHLRLNILDRLVKLSLRMNEQHLSNALFALGTMGASWQKLPTNFIRSISDALLRVNALNRKAVHARSLYSVEGIPAVNSIDNNLNKRSKPMSKYVALNKNQYEIDEFDLPGNIVKQEKVLSTSMISENKMHTQGLSMTIVGLSRLSATWNLLPSTLIQVLESSLINLTPQMNSVQLANTISGLAKSSWRWDMFSDALQRQLLSSIVNSIFRGKQNILQDISITISSLGTLGLCSDSVSKQNAAFSNAFFKSVQYVLRHGSLEEIAGVILGMGFMEFTWQDLPRICRKDIINSILNNFNLSKNVTLSHDQIPFMDKIDQKAVKNNVFDFKNKQLSNSQAIANTMYGLSLMVFDTDIPQLSSELTPVHITLLDAVSNLGVFKFCDSEKEQILIYIHLLHTVLPLSDVSIIDSHCPKHIIRADRPVGPPSKLQESVITSLSNSLRKINDDLEVENEYSAFNGAFPVDATIFEGELPVAFVEIDGPQHFHYSSADGCISKLKRKDIMKETLYRKKHPLATFTRIRFDQVDHFGSNYIGRNIADFITFSKYTSYLLSTPISVETTVQVTSSSKDVHMKQLSRSSSSSSIISSPTAGGVITLYRPGREGWLARQALRQLNSALEFKNHPKNKKQDDISSSSLRVSSIYDHVYADTEEDNS